MDEVRRGGSYISQNDLRGHFGLGQAKTADIEIHWPSRIVDRFKSVCGSWAEAIAPNPTPVCCSNWRREMRRGPLLGAKRVDRIDRARTARRHIAGERRGCPEEDTNGAICYRIGRADFKQ